MTEFATSRNPHQGETFTCEVATSVAMHAVGAALGECVQAGDVIVLDGDLGAGKTQLTQGLAGALGISVPVTSPTFNIMLEYGQGRIPLYHFDLYRLDDESELEDVDFYFYIEGDCDGATCIEWGNKFARALPDDYVDVHICVSDDGARTLQACSHGTRSAALIQAWREQL